MANSLFNEGFVCCRTQRAAVFKTDFIVAKFDSKRRNFEDLPRSSSLSPPNLGQWWWIRRNKRWLNALHSACGYSADEIYRSVVNLIAQVRRGLRWVCLKGNLHGKALLGCPSQYEIILGYSPRANPVRFYLQLDGASCALERNECWLGQKIRSSLKVGKLPWSSRKRSRYGQIRQDGR